MILFDPGVLGCLRASTPLTSPAIDHANSLCHDVARADCPDWGLQSQLIELVENGGPKESQEDPYFGFGSRLSEEIEGRCAL